MVFATGSGSPANGGGSSAAVIPVRTKPGLAVTTGSVAGLGGVPGDAANPNGSLDNIAGILNEKRNVLGLMPHPERMADAELGGTDGRAMFDGLVEALGR